jgi:glycosyltransferase involved in cell wall biosynthesis
MSFINPLDYSTCFIQPLRTDPISAWIEHIPFGMFMVERLRPKTLVELGTHTGVSYCAFCQAVKALQLDTQCYAVDTWVGDQQAGFYGADLLADLRAHHDPLYGDFSHLIQSTFDEAVGHFADGSIDLLHIDGLHTYEAVKHDFETWLPKLSERGVVIFHDTNVHEPDFGVWKLWQEVQEKYPHFEFLHEHGLGIVRVGKDSTPALEPLFSMSDEETRRTRELFFSLGSRYSAQIDRQSKIEALTAQALEKEQRIQALQLQVSDYKQELDGIRNSKVWKFAKILRRERGLVTPDRAIQESKVQPTLTTTPANGETQKDLALEENLALVKSSELFDAAWYLAHNPDLIQGRVDPWVHYVKHGGFEGRDPSSKFSSAGYLSKNKHAQELGINPLVHYLKHKKREGQPVQTDPIIVHQMGKVGSKTLQLSLVMAYDNLGLKVPIYHSHHLNNFEEITAEVLSTQGRRNPAGVLDAVEIGKRIRGLIEEDPTKHWNVISLVRDPVARDISMLFEHLSEYIPDWHMRYSAGTLHAQDLQELVAGATYDRANGWFETQMEPIAAFGIDVYETPFPREIGYKIYPAVSQANLLVIRQENLNECAARAVNEFLGLEDLSLHNANVATQKDYAEFYSVFKKTALPIDYIERLYNTRYARHFYSEAELKAFRKHWLGNEATRKVSVLNSFQTTDKPHATKAATEETHKMGEIVRALKAQVDEREQTIQALVLESDRYKQELGKIKNSTTGRIAEALRENRSLFIPPKSLRDRILWRLIVFVTGGYEANKKLSKRLFIEDDPKHSHKINFDSEFYLRYYSDIAEAGLDPYQHYVEHGRNEGRLPARPAFILQKGAAVFDSAKETVLIVSHDATRTGAPIIILNVAQGLQQRYNVVSVLLGEGPLTEYFGEEAVLVAYSGEARNDPKLAQLMLEPLTESYQFKFAIVNSVESWAVLPALAKLGVPSINLIHEFAANTRPKRAFREAILWATQTVFSTSITRENAIEEYPEFKEVTFQTIPQGLCKPPNIKSDPAFQAQEKDKVLKVLRPEGLPPNTIVILGIGTVQMRKGADLFVDCAAYVMRSGYGEQCRFVWIGNGYDPEHDAEFSVFLLEQIRRSGLQENVFFMEATAEIETAYGAADIMLISSRLDPLPNVAIEAMTHRLPLVCFEQSTGIADLLSVNGLGEACVVPYLDSVKMAEKVIAFMRSENLRQSVGEKLREVAFNTFNMETYVSQLEHIGETARARVVQEQKDREEIKKSGLARLDYFISPHANKRMSLDEALNYQMRAWAKGVDQRKLFPGFHPGIFMEQSGLHEVGVDPLAEYLRAGQPTGLWKQEVITADEKPKGIPTDLRIALHLHVYYPELLPAILKRLVNNQVRPDVFISVPTEQVRDDVQKMVSQVHSVNICEIRVGPNQGRDLGPFLTAFGPTFIEKYDVVGHLHTKKSLNGTETQTGRAWYIFLLENLLGNTHMADIILGRFATDASIGLVFPDDPSSLGWGLNRPEAKILGQRLGLDEKLLENIWFPVGTMFWARVKALRPLFDLHLDWGNYPAEPVPYDGSILHAIERLLPLVAAKQGFRSVVTNVAGVTR